MTSVAHAYSSKIQGRRNSARLKQQIWNPRRQDAIRRKMDRAETPFSDAELIDQAIAEGKVTRLPPGYADGAAIAIRRGDWR